jgi:8-oxo-dGTP diphosphatase
VRAFKTIYWGSDRSTEVVFEPVSELPPIEQVSACMVVALHEDGVVLSRPKRGWGLVGGHREPGETAEECLRREALEEAAAELGELRLVGRWKTQKVFESFENAAYPPVAYQLLYVAKVTRMNEFVPQLEIEERMVVPLKELSQHHHNFADFEDVYEFILDQTS